MTLGTITLPNAKLTGAMPQAPLFAINISFPGDDAYPAGGTPDFQELVRDAIETKMKAAADANIRGRQNVEIENVIAGLCGAYTPIYDKANDKLWVDVKATGVEVAPAVDLSTTTFNVTVVCK
jgi:hypothetical protein